MNERIDEIDDLEASGILENRQSTEKDNEDNSNRSIEDLRTIEELKRSKVAEAVQASTVYNNLSEIPGLNTKEFLNSIVDMYMLLDAKAPGNPEYIDFESLNIIINSVKEHEIDLVQNGIVTNEDGSINRVASAEQIHDMTGIPVSQILAQNKYENNFEISNIKSNVISQQKMFEVVLGNCDGDTKKANEIMNTLKEYSARAEERQKQKNKQNTVSESADNVVNTDNVTSVDNYDRIENTDEADFIELGYEYNIYGEISEEDKAEYIKAIESIKEKHPNNRFVKRVLDENGNIDFNKAVEFGKEFEENYNRRKNIKDLEFYLNSGDTVELNKITDKKERINLFTDIYIAASSGDIERQELATELLLKLRADGVERYSKDLGLVNGEMALNILNAELNNKFTLDSQTLNNAYIKRRMLHSGNAKNKLASIRKSINKTKDIEDLTSDQKDVLSKLTDADSRIKYIYELRKGITVREREKEITNVLEKLDFKRCRLC